jgi:hypothetical protein
VFFEKIVPLDFLYYRDVFKPQKFGREGFVPHLPQRTLSTSTSSPPLALSPSTPMSYFNSSSYLYPTLADGEFDMYSFLNQPPVPEQADDRVYPMFPNHLETVGAPTNLGATAGYGERYSHTLVDRYLTRGFQSR